MKKTETKIDAMLEQNYRKTVYRENGEYVVEVHDLPGVAGTGTTLAGAFAELHAAMRAWMEASQEAGLPIPEPSAPPEFSGRLVVRMPRGLHRKLARQAEAESVSLNQWIVSLLSEGAGAVSASRGQATELRLPAAIPTIISKFAQFGRVPTASGRTTSEIEPEQRQLNRNFLQ